MFKTEINGVKVTISAYGDGSIDALKKLGLNGEVLRNYGSCDCCSEIETIGTIHNGEFYPNSRYLSEQEDRWWDDDEVVASPPPPEPPKMVEPGERDSRLRDHRLRHVTSIWSYYGRFDRGTGDRAFVKKMLGRTVRRMNRQMIREQF